MSFSNRDIKLGSVVQYCREQHYGFYICFHEIIEPDIVYEQGEIVKELPFNPYFGMPHYIIRNNENGFYYEVSLNCIHKIIK